jgi:hypothetical protein
MFEIDLTFPHTYEIEELPELPGSGILDIPLLYFPRLKNRLEHDGLWIKISPVGGKSWIGVFAFGYQSPPAFSRVLSFPDPDRACVISNGAAYMVKADEPEIWELIPVVPVLDVRSIPEPQLIVFADFNSLVAYGKSGRVWRSPRVCWDELKILVATPDIIEGVGNDPANLGQSRFAVATRTGRSLLPPPRSTDGKPLW